MLALQFLHQEVTFLYQDVKLFSKENILPVLSNNVYLLTNIAVCVIPTVHAFFTLDFSHVVIPGIGCIVLTTLHLTFNLAVYLIVLFVTYALFLALVYKLRNLNIFMLPRIKVKVNVEDTDLYLLYFIIQVVIDLYFTIINYLASIRPLWVLSLVATWIVLSIVFIVRSIVNSVAYKLFYSLSVRTVYWLVHNPRYLMGLIVLVIVDSVYLYVFHSPEVLTIVLYVGLGSTLLLLLLSPFVNTTSTSLPNEDKDENLYTLYQILLALALFCFMHLTIGVSLQYVLALLSLSIILVGLFVFLAFVVVISTQCIATGAEVMQELQSSVSECVEPSIPTDNVPQGKAETSSVQQRTYSTSTPSSSVGSDTIPFHITSQIIASTVAVEEMFEFAKANSPVLYRYMVDNCSHLLTLTQGSTGMPVDAIGPHMVNHPDAKVLGASNSVQNNKGADGKSGLYVFYLTATGEVCYIGSATDYFARLRTHYHELKQVDTTRGLYTYMKSKGGPQNFSYMPLLALSKTNYITDYVQKHLDSDDTVNILKLLTLYEIRVLEQAALSYFTPTCNSQNDVIIGITDWVNMLGQDSKGHPVEVHLESGEVLPLSSFGQASRTTGIRVDTISSSCNVKPDPVKLFSPTLNTLVHFVSSVKGVKTQRATTYNVKGSIPFDIEGLPLNKVFLLDQDYNLMPGHIYPTGAAAVKAIGSDTNQSKYINKNHLIKAPLLGLGQSVYLVKNPNALIGQSSVYVKVTDSTGVDPVKLFPSTASAMRAYGHNPKHSNRHLNRDGKVRGGRYKFTYASDEDLVKYVDSIQPK